MLITELLINDDDEENANKIIRECSQAVAAYRKVGKMLYRGIKNQLNQMDFLYVDSPSNRQSIAVPEEAQYVIDTALALINCKARRANSILTTSNEGHAKSFGRSYSVFPVDGFSFTWSKTIVDFGALYLDAGDLEWRKETNKLTADELRRYNIVASLLEPNAASNPRILQRFLDYAKIDHQDFSAAVKSGHEVMIHGRCILAATYIGDNVMKMI